MKTRTIINPSADQQHGEYEQPFPGFRNRSFGMQRCISQAIVAMRNFKPVIVPLCFEYDETGYRRYDIGLLRLVYNIIRFLITGEQTMSRFRHDMIVSK